MAFERRFKELGGPARVHGLEFARGRHPFLEILAPTTVISRLLSRSRPIIFLSSSHGRRRLPGSRDEDPHELSIDLSIHRTR